MKLLDFRSDTVTKPDEGMRRAMYEAEVGDDVYGDDPTVKRLQQKAAEISGKENALFVTSGTMGNLVSLLTHDIHGKSVIAGKECHIVNYEGGGISVFAGAFCQQVDDETGLPNINDMERVFKVSDNVHFAPSKLLCLENTHNRRGGNASYIVDMKLRTDWAKKHEMAVHLDGARVFNASAATGEKVSDICAVADSVQICLSKGLGAPMGSLVCGTQPFVERAKFWRKRLGGGLRQVGIIAAAGLYAFEHNIERLADDNKNAAAISAIFLNENVKIRSVPNPTNMVYFEIKDASKTEQFRAACADKGVVFNSTMPGVYRLVTHLDITKDDALTAANLIVKEMKILGV